MNRKRVTAIVAIIAAGWTAVPVAAASPRTAVTPPELLAARHEERSDVILGVGQAIPRGEIHAAINPVMAKRLAIRRTTGLVGSLPGPRPGWKFWIIVAVAGAVAFALSPRD